MGNEEEEKHTEYAAEGCLGRCVATFHRNRTNSLCSSHDLPNRLQYESITPTDMFRAVVSYRGCPDA